VFGWQMRFDLGAGFPLLFGGGPGSIAGGVLGSLVGSGFGGQILGGAIGQIFDDLIASTAALNKEFLGLTDTLDPLFQNSGLFVGAGLDQQYREARGRGDYAGAAAIARQPLLQTGDVTGRATQVVGAGVQQLQEAWDGVYKTVALTVGLVASPFVAALTLVLRLTQLIFGAVNGVLTLFGQLVEFIPGLKGAVDSFYNALDSSSGAKQQRIAELQREIDAAKEVNAILETTARLRAGGAGLTGADKTRFDAQVDALERQKELEKEILAIRRDSKAGNNPEELAKVEGIVAQKRREFALKEGQIRAEVQARLLREQIAQDRQRADTVLGFYREQFAFARRAYDLELARIDQARQEADYERAVVDYRLKLEDQIASKRAESTRKELEVADLQAQAAAKRVGIAADADAFQAGPGRVADAIRVMAEYDQNRITMEQKQLAAEIETALQIDALRRAARQEERQLDADRIQMERQRDGLIRSRVALERQVEDYKMDTADYQRRIAREIADNLMIVAANLNAAFAAGAAGMSGMVGGGVGGDTGLRLGNTGTSTGPHFHIEKADRSPISDAEARALLNPEISRRLTNTSGYGQRWGRLHAGQDLAGPEGTPLSLAPGFRVSRIERNNGAAGNTAWVLGPGGELYRILHLQNIPPGWEARLAKPPAAGGGASSPMWGYLRRLEDLETDSNPRPQAGGPARGALQFETVTALDAQRRFRIPAVDLQSNSRNIAYPATSRFIQAAHPEAYQAILAGDYDRADALLKGRWSALPGGRTPRDAATQARARQFLPGGARGGANGGNGVPASLMALPPPANISRPTWAAPPSAVPSNAAAQAAVTQETERQVTAVQALRDLQRELLQLGDEELSQKVAQTLEGERLMTQKKNELEIERAKLGVIAAGSDAEQQRAEQAATQETQMAQRLRENEEIRARIVGNEKLSAEERLKRLAALERNIENLREVQALEKDILDTQIRQRIEREAANNIRAFNTAGEAQGRGLYGAGAQEYDKFKQLGATDEEAMEQARLARLTQYKQKMAEIQGEINRLNDPLTTVTTGAEALGAAFSDAFVGIASGSQTASEALSAMFKSIGASFLQMAAQILANQAMLAILKLFAPAGGGPVPGFETGGLFNTPLSFAGGGYTGDAPRSGGVDGMGGFPAILHPQETVVDHTEPLRPSGQMMADGSATPEISYDGPVLHFNSTEYVMKKDVPKIIAAGTAATGSKMRNSVSFGKRAGI
jgi:hypothetical protein